MIPYYVVAKYLTNGPMPSGSTSREHNMDSSTSTSKEGIPHSLSYSVAFETVRYSLSRAESSKDFDYREITTFRI